MKEYVLPTGGGAAGRCEGGSRALRSKSWVSKSWTRLKMHALWLRLWWLRRWLFGVFGMKAEEHITSLRAEEANNGESHGVGRCSAGLAQSAHIAMQHILGVQSA